MQEPRRTIFDNPQALDQTLDALGRATEALQNPPQKPNFFSRFRRQPSEPAPSSQFRVSAMTLLFETLGIAAVWVVVFALFGKGFRLSPAFLISMNAIAFIMLVYAIYFRGSHRLVERIAQHAISFGFGFGFVQLLSSIKL